MEGGERVLKILTWSWGEIYINYVIIFGYFVFFLFFCFFSILLKSYI